MRPLPSLVEGRPLTRNKTNVWETKPMTVTDSAEAYPPASSTPVRDSRALTPATRDTTSFLGVLVGMAVAAIGGGLVTLIAWFVFKQVSLPAFNTSMVTRGLSTAGIVATVVIVAGLLYLWVKRGVHGKGPLAWLTVAVAYLSPALIVISSVGRSEEHTSE